VLAVGAAARARVRCRHTYDSFFCFAPFDLGWVQRHRPAVSACALPPPVMQRSTRGPFVTTSVSRVGGRGAAIRRWIGSIDRQKEASARRQLDQGASRVCDRVVCVVGGGVGTEQKSRDPCAVFLRTCRRGVPTALPPRAHARKGEKGNLCRASLPPNGPATTSIRPKRFDT
jgi:hypothetical protein